MFTPLILGLGRGRDPDDLVVAWAILADLLLALLVAVTGYRFALIDTCSPKG